MECSSAAHTAARGQGQPAARARARFWRLWLRVGLVALGLTGGVRGAPAPLTPVPVAQVVIEDAFWSPKLKVWREVTIPDCFAKFEQDGALTNFDRVREGRSGQHAGPPWYDGLIYEMIRASADFLAARREAALEGRVDGYIERIAAAQARHPQGYLNTYTQLERPHQPWGLNGGDDNWQHDVYNAGALVEAAVHYYRATGKTRLLEVAVRLANHMADVMGPPPKANVVPGHSLPEEALVKLYGLFKEEPGLKARMPVPVEELQYLRLAEFWIENRGRHAGRKSFGAYGQDHRPVLEQETLEGHAVRATLLCAGVVAAARANGRADYLAAATRLWSNMVQRRMYITGGLGAVAQHEGFGGDYELPNDGYLETCAAVGAGFFHHQLNLALGEARYADELERVLYNAILTGVSLSGDRYFYDNPLAAGPQRQRWAWHSCPCCPPMFLKIMGALPGCIYAQAPGEVYVNLFIGSRTTVPVQGVPVHLRQLTRYPWEGEIKLVVTPERAVDFALYVRLPGWGEQPRLRVNGRGVGTVEVVRGYARLQRTWRRGEVVELSLPLPVRRVQAHPKVEANRGRVALQRGPLFYCLEGVDHGGSVRHLVIPPEAPLRAEHQPGLLGGVTVLRGPAVAVHRAEWPDTLYLPQNRVPGMSNATFMAIPYFAHANRQAGEMRVWMAETPLVAEPLPRPTLASGARASASHCFARDTVAALNDQVEPAASDDAKIPRFTWWDHRGTVEWVQYDFGRPVRVRAVEVYWWDERRIQAHCRVPQSWRVLYRDGEEWRPVSQPSGYGTEMDRFNRVTFAPVETRALRLEVQLQPGWSGGILEWRVE
ncbi:MAG: glycoside hydrolase family 127 protein [Verrucomicrobiae bacterium]|nr:glycoside hydrolase family 127 protein [Verrucomicrobiae bacterium]